VEEFEEELDKLKGKVNSAGLNILIAVYDSNKTIDG